MTLPYTIQDVDKYGAPVKSTIRSWFGSRRRNSLILLLLLLCLGVFGYHGYSSSFTVFPDNLSGASMDSSSMLTTDTVKMEVKKLITSHPLIVFSKTYCPYSKKAKAILNSFTYKSSYHIVEVDLRNDDDKMKQALGEISGRYTFPNVFVHGKSIGGASEIESLHQQNQLSSLLSSAGIIIA